MKYKYILIPFIMLIIFTSCKSKDNLTSPDHYIIKKSFNSKVKTGDPVEFKIEIIPTDGFKMEEEAPINLKISKENNPDIEFERVTYTKNELLNKDIKKPVFTGKFTPKKQGNHIVKCELSFVVCTSSVCEPKKAEVVFDITSE